MAVGQAEQVVNEDTRVGGVLEDAAVGAPLAGHVVQAVVLEQLLDDLVEVHRQVLGPSVHLFRGQNRLVVDIYESKDLVKLEGDFEELALPRLVLEASAGEDEARLLWNVSEEGFTYDVARDLVEDSLELDELLVLANH